MATEGLDFAGQTESKLRTVSGSITAVEIWIFLLFEPYEWKTQREKNATPRSASYKSDGQGNHTRSECKEMEGQL